MMFLRQAKRFVSGEPVENAHPAITMFSTCASMNWNMMPVEGGIYDQDPQLMHYFKTLWSLQGEHEKKENEKRKKDSSRSSSRS